MNNDLGDKVVGVVCAVLAAIIFLHVIIDNI